MKLFKLHIEGLKPGKERRDSFVNCAINLLFKTINTTIYYLKQWTQQYWPFFHHSSWNAAAGKIIQCWRTTAAGTLNRECLNNLNIEIRVIERYYLHSIIPLMCIQDEIICELSNLLPLFQNIRCCRFVKQMYLDTF
jgi:hypothetical protein